MYTCTPEFFKYLVYLELKHIPIFDVQGTAHTAQSQK